MNTVHLYLRPAAAGGINHLRTTFAPGAPVPTQSRGVTSAADIPAWLAAQVADPEVKAIYNCHGTGLSKPEACGAPWLDLPAGHPVEKI